MNLRMNNFCSDTKCDPSRLNDLLAGLLSDAEAQNMEQHLSTCKSCAEQLQSNAAVGSSWEVTKSLLAEDEFDRPEGWSLTSSQARNEDQRLSRLQTADVLTREIRGWLDPTDDPESLGRFAGYEIVGIVGHGGMGIVLKGFEASLNRIVAIKVLAPRLATNGSARKRFAREAQAAAAVRHENVIAIHRVDDWHGLPFLVMPYVGGTSLEKRIENQGPLSVEQALRVSLQIASGLEAAHAQGLVHRDIKPANILLEQGVERVTITDFGLARAADDASLTRTGVIAGTPQYMSPEQSEGQALDARSDLFSLGSVMYAMVTGRSPFRGEASFEVMKRIIHEPARSMQEIEPSVPQWFERIVQKLHSKAPDDRYQSAGEVVQLLETCIAHLRQPALTPLPSSLTCKTQYEAIRRPPIWKWLVAAGLASFLFMAGIVIVLESDKGTMKIECEADNVPIRIIQKDHIVEKLSATKSGKTLRLAAGNYVVEIDGEFDGMNVQHESVILKRGQTEIVKIVQTPRAVPASSTGTFSEGSVSGLSSPPRIDVVDLDSVVARFNQRMQQTPSQERQPELTSQEVIAFATWKLDHEKDLSKSLQQSLRQIGLSNQLAKDWEIDGGYVNVEVGESSIRTFEIALVNRQEQVRENIRQRCLSTLKPVPATPPEESDGTPLAAAIKGFNNRYQQADGQAQPKLTEEEIVAAILYWQNKRNDANVDNALFESFQRIAKTRQIPKGAALEMLSHFENAEGTRHTIWSIRIRMPHLEQGKEGWTHAFTIREQFISVKHGDAGTIHWGKPGDNGLQAGFRLSPPLLTYEIGQQIQVEFFYRNVLGTPLKGSLPNAFTYESVELYDKNGRLIEVQKNQDLEIVAGWMVESFGEQPTSRKGQPLVLSRKWQDSVASKGWTNLVVAAGGKYRLRFSVNNYADEGKGTLPTGDFEFEVRDPKAKSQEGTNL